MATELLIATRSSDKLAEIAAIIASAARVQLLTLGDLALPSSGAEADIEAHASFLANAVAKARFFAALTGRRTLADDSGLAVAALGGAPGVRTKRFALDYGRAATGIAGRELDEANNELLLELLAEVPPERRTAHYVCAAALADSDRLIASAIGTCRGSIAHARAGTGGFGYDPLFIVHEVGVTFAQLPRAEKNLRSHRAKAFRALVPHIRH